MERNWQKTVERETGRRQWRERLAEDSGERDLQKTAERETCRRQWRERPAEDWRDWQKTEERDFVK